MSPRSTDMRRPKMIAVLINEYIFLQASGYAGTVLSSTSRSMTYVKHAIAIVMCFLQHHQQQQKHRYDLLSQQR